MRIHFIFAAVVLALSGCANVPTHDSKVASTLAATSRGNIEEAITQLESQTAGADKADLLLNLEKGEMMRIGTRYKDSQLAFEIADVKIKGWEETAKSNPAKLFGQVGAVLLGDHSRAYEGQDYEKVMLTTRMAMNRLNLGDLDTARVDIKRTHEREAVIAEFRAKETEEAEKEAKQKGITPGAKELNGYPVEIFSDPEVLKLKNGFQNALSHYMAGFVYEALDEPSLAAPGYRKAIELRPDLPVLEEGLRGLDQRTSFRRKKGVTDVLFVIEAGNAPARLSQKVTFPVPTPKGLVTIAFTFPVIYPDKTAPVVNQVKLGELSLPTALITDFNVMARKALKDELPAIQMRAAVRSVGKVLIQDQMNKSMGALGGLLGNIAAVATEGPADDRMWRGLPERVFIARSFVTPGEYQVRIPDQADGTKTIAVGGRYMVIPVRIFKDKTYFGEPVQFGTIAAATQRAANDIEDKPLKANATGTKEKTVKAAAPKTKEKMVKPITSSTGTDSKSVAPQKL